MGVMTCTMGGVIRDVLCNVPPVVFHSPLYATVCWAGSLLFMLMLYLRVELTVAAVVAGFLIFFSRLLAIVYGINLPRFLFKE